MSHQSGASRCSVIYSAVKAAATTAVIAAISGISPAVADAGDPGVADDMRFLSALATHGFGYAAAGKAIAAGRIMCDYVDQGKTGTHLVVILQKHNDELTRERALEFMETSIGIYCPDKLEKGMNDPPPKAEKHIEEREEEEGEAEAKPWQP